MRINIQNVEEMVFMNKDVWRKMPEMTYLRDQWRMSRSTPMLRSLGRKSALDFLSKAKNHHEHLLSEHFGEEVTIDRIDRHLVKNMEFEAECELVDFDLEEHYTAFSAHRDENKVYVTFWR
jgi:hypothetical protein